MKNKLSRPNQKIFLGIMFGLLPSTACIAQTDMQITLSQTGTLSTELTDEQKANVESLTIKTAEGVILNAEDFKTLNTLPKLKTLDLSGDMNTTALPDSTFTGNTTLETIKFPPSIKTLGTNSFDHSNLTGTVSLPDAFDNVNEFIGRFDDCQHITAFAFNETNPKLEAIDGVVFTKDKEWLVRYPCGKEEESYSIPEGYKKIKIEAFAFNNHLKNLTLPASFTAFDRLDNTFGNYNTKEGISPMLERILVAEGNAQYASISNGMLMDKLSKTLMLCPINYPETSVIIEGDKIQTIGDGCFRLTANLKQVKLTEGVTKIGVAAFRPLMADGALNIEYIELPSTINYLGYAAFYGLCPTIKSFICKASTVPDVDGDIIFRGSNSTGVKFGVSPEAVDTYKNSKFGSRGNFFQPDAIVPYHTLTYENCSAFQDVAVEGVSITLTAEPAPAGKSFARWEAEPSSGSFSDPYSPTTLYTVPNENVTIRAIYESDRTYTILGATGMSNGSAAIGTRVTLETAGEKEENGEWLTFKEWRVNKGNVIIDNPLLVSTFFQMIAGDGNIEIEAVYGKTYMINIIGGHGPVEAFEGETVEIYADPSDGYEFVNWTTESTEVIFADASSDTTTFVMPTDDVTVSAHFAEKTRLLHIPALQYSIFPNPATNYITVNDVEPKTVYAIYDMLGTLMKQGVVSESTIHINEIPAGQYILQMKDQSIHFIKR